ncbi:6121_t:CDS:2, partial [Dentiscutata erythropus]
KLKDGEIHIFNANTTMIHDRKCCPHGAVEYDEAGIEYPICTCYRETSKYCAEHKHATNPCKCEPEEELSLEKKKVKILAQQIEKYEVTEKLIWEKETSLFHCEGCKEVERHYEYCTASIILCHKTIYENEKEISRKINEDLKEYKNLFEEYERMEKNREKE